MSGSGVLYKDGALRSSAEGGQNGAKCRVRISCALRFLLLLIAEIGERKGIQIKRAGGVSGFGFDGCGERGKIRIRFVHGTGSASEHESKSKTRQGPGHGGTSSIGSRSQKTQARFERQLAAWPLTDCEDVERFGADFCGRRRRTSVTASHSHIPGARYSWHSLFFAPSIPRGIPSRGARGVPGLPPTTWRWA